MEMRVILIRYVETYVCCPTTGDESPSDPESDTCMFIQRTKEQSLRMADLIVKSAVKEQLNELNVAADFYDAFDEEVADLLEDAAQRAEANDRKRVQPRDL